MMEELDKRIVIIGGPRTGKTTYAARFSDVTDWIRCSDPKAHGGNADDRFDLPERERWSAVSAEVAGWLDRPGPWVVEGVAVIRALRKWRDAHPGCPCPCEEVHLLTRVKIATLTTGQESMTKGVMTIFRELVSWMRETAQLVLPDEEEEDEELL